MTLTELKEMINADMAIDIKHLSDNSATNALLYTKYVHLLSDLNIEVRKTEYKIKNVKYTRWLYYSGKGSGIVSPTIYNATELKRVLEVDPEIIEVEKMMIILNEKKFILEEAIKGFQARGFNIANVMKWEMFKHGG